VPKIGTVMVLIILILVGVAVLALAVAVMRRQATESRKLQDVDSEGGEREVYERLYGRRSMTVSAPVPAERPPEADVDSPQAGLSE
jgi:hypothetical protein